MAAARNQAVAVRRPCASSRPRKSGSKNSEWRRSRNQESVSRNCCKGGGGWGGRIMVGSPRRGSGRSVLLPFTLTGEPLSFKRQTWRQIPNELTESAEKHKKSRKKMNECRFWLPADL